MAEEKKSEEIKNIVKIEDAGPCKKKVSVEVLQEKIKEALSEEYKELKHGAEVPGFRKGRAPMRLLEKKFGSDITKQVKLKLLAEASESAVSDNEIDVLGDPDIKYDEIELPDEGSMKFDFEVEVRPEFELPSLEGIAVDKPKIEIGDDEINEQIASICKRAGVWEPKDGSVEDDDQVVADVLMDIEGVEEDDKRENIEITSSANGFVGGVPVEKLNELLAGAKAGDEKKTKVDVPATFYNEQLRGKSIEITIDIKDVKQLVPAELNEEFFTRIGVDDADELKDRISEQLEQQADSQAKQQMAEQIHEYLRKNVELDLPESIVADQSTRILQRQYSNMLMQGMEREQMDQQMGQLRSSSEDEARQQLKTFFVMDKVAENFKVEVTDEEVNSRIAQVAAMQGRRPEKMREELARDGSLAQFSLEIREQKCIEKMLETAEITEVDAAKKEKKAVKQAKKKAAKKAEKKPAAKTAKKKIAKKKTKEASDDTIAAKRTKTKATRKKSGVAKDKKEK